MGTKEVLEKITHKGDYNFSLLARNWSAGGNVLPLMKECREGWSSLGDGKPVNGQLYNDADVITLQAWADQRGIGPLQWGVSGSKSWARLRTPLTGSQLCDLRRWVKERQRIARAKDKRKPYAFNTL